MSTTTKPGSSARPSTQQFSGKPAVVATAPPRGRLRLTRRGRLVLVLLFVALCFVAFSLGRTSSQASTSPSGPATRAVTVEPGQTLWQIAKTAVPGADPRDTIDRIRELNGMSTAPVQAGQRLIVPA